jgi:hypothetical protein
VQEPARDRPLDERRSLRAAVDPSGALVRGSAAGLLVVLYLVGFPDANQADKQPGLPR